MKLLLCYGARPAWFKIQPLIPALKKENIFHKILYIQQHTDLLAEEDTCFDFQLSISNDSDNRLNNILSSILKSNFNFLDEITHILIPGDTSSALGMAIVGFHYQKKIIHLEAGLRTFDKENPYPEEMNRVLISRLADIHFCPTKESYDNLVKENCAGLKYVVGNTPLDNLLQYKHKTNYSNKVIVTLHRRENLLYLDKWLYELEIIAKRYSNLEFIFPMHPNPGVIKYKNTLKSVKVCNPLVRANMLSLLCESKFIITDSGGLQEEGSFLNKKVIVCRKKTERDIKSHSHIIICDAPEKLASLVEETNNNYKINDKCPFGDGHASEKIVSILKCL